MGGVIDLRDLDGEEREDWQAAIADQVSWATFDQLADNASYMVPEHEWDDYARAEAEDLCEIPDFLAPFIDWEAWAESLKHDYSTIVMDGTTYLFHAF